MPEILGSFDSRLKARRHREALAAELGAQYYASEDAYRYFREGVERMMRVVRVEIGKDVLWQVVVEVK